MAMWLQQTPPLDFHRQSLAVNTKLQAHTLGSKAKHNIGSLIMHFHWD